MVAAAVPLEGREVLVLSTMLLVVLMLSCVVELGVTESEAVFKVELGVLVESVGSGEEGGAWVTTLVINGSEVLSTVELVDTVVPGNGIIVFVMVLVVSGSV